MNRVRLHASKTITSRAITSRAITSKAINRKLALWAYLFVIVLGFFAMPETLSAALYEKELEVFLRQPQSQPIRVMALFHYQNQMSVPAIESSANILQFLVRQNREVYAQWIQELTQNQVKATDLRVTGASWINHSVSLWVTPQGLRHVLASSLVKKVYWIKKENSESQASRILVNPTQVPQYGFVETHLSELRKIAPQIVGTNQLVGMIDTGVNVSSGFLSQKVIRFFDASTKQFASPFDFGDHGTGIASLLVGGSTQNALSVAPGAKLIVSAGFDTEHLIRGLEFMANPDGDLRTTQDIPRVVNNSWNSDGQSDQEVYYRALATLESLGVVMVFSAGNSGPQMGSISHPKEFPTTLVVGATQPGGSIWTNSSAGPAQYKGQSVNKPDLVAPGVDVLSLSANGQWIAQTGTSFSAPWVSGAVALINQARPGMSAGQIRQLLISNTDRFQGGWHPQFGFGRLNIVRALRGSQANGQTNLPPGTTGRDFSVQAQNIPKPALALLFQWAHTQPSGWRQFQVSPR